MGSHLKMPPNIVPVSNLARILPSSDGRRQLLARCLLQVHCPLLPSPVCVRQQREEFGSHDFWRSREFLSESWRAAQTAAAALPSAAGLPLPSMLLLMGKREYPPPSFLSDAMTEGGVGKTMRRREEKEGRGIVCRSFGSSINRRGARMRADAVLKQAIEKIGCCGVFRDFSQGTF